MRTRRYTGWSYLVYDVNLKICLIIFGYSVTVLHQICPFYYHYRSMKIYLQWWPIIFPSHLQDYKQFWTSFGKNIKLGCIEDTSNHKRIAPLLRFNSSKNEEELISLDQYVDSMKADQKAIYYLAADTIKSAKSAPFLEELLKRDYEVGCTICLEQCVRNFNMYRCEGRKLLTLKERGYVHMGYMMVCRNP